MSDSSIPTGDERNEGERTPEPTAPADPTAAPGNGWALPGAAGAADRGADATPTAEELLQPAPAETRAATAAPAAVAAPFAYEAAPGDSFRRDRRRGLLVPIIAAAVVAALIGGGAGALIATAVEANNSTQTVGSTTQSGSGGQNVTINNAKTATVISAVAAKASPSVVTISVAGTSESGTGSGIVLSSDGYVLTNNHVVTLDGESSTGTISVTTSGGRIYPATVVGTDPINDIAVIKLTGASGMKPATFADSSKLNVGDTAIAIGAPLGLAGTVTNGIVSALNRSISVASSAVPKSGSGDSSNGGSSGEDSPFNFWNGDGSGSSGSTGTTTTSTISLAVIQTDAAINPGNSGGALLNANGDVIGINVAIASAGSTTSSTTQSGSIGVGFAIPSNVAHRIATELMDKQKATHGLLGASVEDASSATKSSVAGALIAKVIAGGAAASAGVRQGDVITTFDGVAIASAADLTAQVRSLAGGSTTTLSYVRGGAAHSVTVKLGTYTG